MSRKKLHATMTVQPPNRADFETLLEAHGKAWQRARRAEEREASVRLEAAARAPSPVSAVIDIIRENRQAAWLSFPELRELAQQMIAKALEPGGGGTNAALALMHAAIDEAAKKHEKAQAGRAALDATGATGQRVLLALAGVPAAATPAASSVSRPRKVLFTPGGQPVDVPADASLAGVIALLKEHAPIANESAGSLHERAKAVRSALATLVGLDGPPPLLASAWPGATKTARVLAAMSYRDRNTRFDFATVKAASALAHGGAAI